MAHADWSPPTAIGIGGLGGGFNAGAEMVDCLIVLNSRAAVRSFMSVGSLQLGGNLALAIGPLGRSGEASAAMNADMKMAAMFSYSMSRGLYGGVTIEGTALLDRPDANATVYGRSIKPDEILKGDVDAPPFAVPLMTRLEEITGDGTTADTESLQSDSASELSVPPGSAAAYAPRTNRRAAPRPPTSSKPTRTAGMDDLDRQLQRTSISSEYDRPSQSRASYAPRPQASVDSYDSFARDAPAADEPSSGLNSYAPYKSRRPRRPIRPEPEDEWEPTAKPGSDDPFADPFEKPAARAPSAYAPSDDTSSFARESTASYAPYKSRRSKALIDLDQDEEDEDEEPPAPAPAPAPASQPPSLLPTELLEGDLVVALHDFEAQEPSDLSFKRGDIIRVLKRTDNESDWWTGELAAAFSSEKPESGMYVSLLTQVPLELYRAPLELMTAGLLDDLRNVAIDGRLIVANQGDVYARVPLR